MEKLLFISIVLILWSLIYKAFHCRSDFNASNETELPNTNTLNGCGASMCGGFQVANSDKKIYYIFLTILFIPFIPLGCIVAKKVNTDVDFGVTTQYEIFGKTKMTFGEVICCYMMRWGLLLLAIYLIFLFHI